LPEWEKRTKLAEAEWIVTCTNIARSHLAGLTSRPEAVWLCYHGFDLERFEAPPQHANRRNGGDPHQPVIILSVGRAVPKKGYDDLLEALALLPADLEWRLVHIGGGALAGALRVQAERLGLSHRIEWRGAMAQPEVLAAYREADIFALASKVARDGDRDGLPNVLIEAQSQQLACVSTDVSAIPELIEHDVTGLLVSPGNPIALAEALERVIRYPEERVRLGAAGEHHVRRLFSMEAGIDLLAARFGLASASPWGSDPGEPVLPSPGEVSGRRQNADQMECVSPFTRR
jgi:glycosyltransferase involved in cell wall biosynthesis